MFNLLKYASKEDEAMIKSGALKTFDVVTFSLKNCVFDPEQTNVCDEKLSQYQVLIPIAIEKGH